jgi:hypothetical protein
MTKENAEQLSLLGTEHPVCHFYDRNGALRTGYLIRRFTKGVRKGRFLVEDVNGKRFVPERIRNIEIK